MSEPGRRPAPASPAEVEGPGPDTPTHPAGTEAAHLREQLEAVLMVVDEPVTVVQLAQATGAEPERVAATLSADPKTAITAERVVAQLPDPRGHRASLADRSDVKPEAAQILDRAIAFGSGRVEADAVVGLDLRHVGRQDHIVAVAQGLDHGLERRDAPLLVEALAVIAGAADGAEAEPLRFSERAFDVEWSAAVGAQHDVAGLDVTMHDLRSMRSRRPEVPVLVLSGNEDPAVVRECIDLGAFGFV